MALFRFKVISIFVSKYKLKFEHELKRIEKDYQNKSLDSFENITLIKYYKAEKFESNRLFRVLENYQVRGHSTLQHINLYLIFILFRISKIKPRRLGGF